MNWNLQNEKQIWFLTGSNIRLQNPFIGDLTVPLKIHDFNVYTCWNCFNFLHALQSYLQFYSLKISKILADNFMRKYKTVVNFHEAAWERYPDFGSNFKPQIFAGFIREQFLFLK